MNVADVLGWLAPFIWDGNFQFAALLLTGGLLFPMLGCAAAGPTWIMLNHELYGAKADEGGEIGGGAGYARTVATGDYIVTDLEALLAALAQAKPGEVVFIPGETEIDLTTRIYIEQLALEVPGGVTLAGNRGVQGSPGALLTSDALKTPVMIRAAGPGVRIAGLRVRGPNAKRYLDHHRRSFGPGDGGPQYYYKFPTSSGIITEHPQLEVDNCEVSAFGLAGIYMKQGAEHKIHHNYIHHCQYEGLGYGVRLEAATALIEDNLFNWNRHSIAGSGQPGCGYHARNNVVLETAHGHCFDMHGGRDREDGTDIAGTLIEISNNIFYPAEMAVLIRGFPQEKCDVHHNWFPTHATPAGAVGVLSAKTKAFNNLYGANPGAAI
jgi:hypothetical protein